MLVAVGLGFALGARWLHLHAIPEGPVYLSVLYTLGLLALLTAALAKFYQMFLKKIAAASFLLGGAILLFLRVLVTSDGCREAATFSFGRFLRLCWRPASPRSDQARFLSSRSAFFAR